jgi:hypothetical protein
VNAPIEISAVMSGVTSVLRDVVMELQELKQAPNRQASVDDSSQRQDARGSRAEQEAGVSYEVESGYDVPRRAPIDYGYGDHHEQAYARRPYVNSQNSHAINVKTPSFTGNVDSPFRSCCLQVWLGTRREVRPASA